MSYEIGGTWEEINEHGAMHCAGIFCDGNIVAETYDEDFNFAKERARRIVACVNACKGISTKTLEHANAHREKLNGINTAYEIAAKERDTYRDLCAELLEAAQGYVPHMPTSTVKEGGANRHSGMLKASDNLKSAISKAEKLLGENNAT